MRSLLFWLLASAAATLYAQTTASVYDISTVAGTGTSGFSGDGGASTGAQLANPCGLALTGSGTLFISDQLNERIRQIASGTISTVAGNGTAGFAGDGKAATAAELASPCGIAVDSSGNVYVSDTANNVIRKFTVGGSISTIAGNQAAGPSLTGDGGPAKNAQLWSPSQLAVDKAGNLYIADEGNQRIRIINSSGIINTFAGTGQGYQGDGGLAINAALNNPTGVAVDSSGNVYIADSGNQVIRRVTPDGKIATFAGTGTGGYSGDLGPALSAKLNYPTSVAVDSSGNLYISDRLNSRVRKVFTNGTIITIAGNGQRTYTGDGGVATGTALSSPIGITVDAAGDVYIADAPNNAVRLLTPIASSAQQPTVTSVNSVWDSSTSVPAGSWLQINGTNLAATTRSWTGTDFNGNASPTTLSGTTVTIGNQPAVISYISGSQINALVPNGLGTGPQTLTVSTTAGTSAPFTLQIDPTQVALLAPPVFSIGGKQYVDAILSGGAGYALPAGSVSSVAERPAMPGETITLYGIGFGSVSPAVPYGEITQQDDSITGSLQIFFGGTAAKITYEGLTPETVGLYQFNVVVPSGVSGDAVPLTFTYNSVNGAQTLYTAVGSQ